MISYRYRLLTPGTSFVINQLKAAGFTIWIDAEHACTYVRLFLEFLHSKLVKVKGKGQVLDIALLHDEHMLKSSLQSRKWQLIGMS